MSEVKPPVNGASEGHSANVHPLLIAKPAAESLAVPPAKTQLKLTSVSRKQKGRLEENLLEIETMLDNAYDAFHAGSMVWSDIERLDQKYREVIDEVNDLVYTVHEEMEDFFSERTEKWQESERGEAYELWMDAWDVDISSEELPEPDAGGDLNLTAFEMFCDLPGEPEW